MVTEKIEEIDYKQTIRNVENKLLYGNIKGDPTLSKTPTAGQTLEEMLGYDDLVIESNRLTQHND